MSDLTDYLDQCEERARAVKQVPWKMTDGKVETDLFVGDLSIMDDIPKLISIVRVLVEALEHYKDVNTAFLGPARYPAEEALRQAADIVGEGEK